MEVGSKDLGPECLDNTDTLPLNIMEVPTPPPTEKSKGFRENKLSADALRAGYQDVRRRQAPTVAMEPQIAAPSSPPAPPRPVRLEFTPEEEALLLNICVVVLCRFQGKLRRGHGH